MKRYKAGSFCSFDEEEDYYTDDFMTFYKENDEILNNDSLEHWIVWLNSPWSSTSKNYKIKHMNQNEPTWECEYLVVAYDGIQVSIFGYGNTETEALENCIAHFRMMQDKYNIEKLEI